MCRNQEKREKENNKITKFSKSASIEHRAHWTRLIKKKVKLKSKTQEQREQGTTLQSAVVVRSMHAIRLSIWFHAKCEIKVYCIYGCYVVWWITSSSGPNHHQSYNFSSSLFLLYPLYFVPFSIMVWSELWTLFITFHKFYRTASSKGKKDFILQRRCKFGA